jgi:cyclic pyranopterin phosphate synthase
MLQNPTARLAVAQAIVEMPLRAFQALSDANVSAGQRLVSNGAAATPTASNGAKELSSKKGPVFATAIIAGTMGAKRTHELIPFCHPLSLESCKFDVETHVDEQAGAATVRITCSAGTTNKTGVEMEALVGANIAALTVYDMCKAVTHDMKITEVKLLHKSGGKSSYNAAEK